MIVDSLNYAAWHFDHSDGYGLWSLMQTRALINEGLRVRPVPMREYQFILKDTPDYLLPYMGLTWDKPTLQVGVADGWAMGIAGRVYGLTMHEDDVLPEGWADAINDKVDALFVPCPFYVDVFKAGGVKKPIHINHGGIDPNEAYPLPAVDRPYTFLALADRGERKGFEVAFNAFRAAFPTQTDVRLIFKTTSPTLTFDTLRAAEPRLRVISRRVDSMSQIYALADCYVYPSYGDGWGLTPRQTVAHGIPTIAPRHTGLEVGIDEWATVILETFTRPRSYYYEGTQGRWFKPTVEETAAAMRWCYENREQARAKAQAGRQWLLNNQTWAHSVRQLVGVMTRYG